MKRSSPSFAPLLLLVLALAASPVEAARKPRSIQSATSVEKLWSESQHVYVKGDVGVSEEQLEELEAWLATNAPHWTVVFLWSAAGERFVDAEGTTFTGIDAALHALGKGLSNRTRFGALKHPKTQEPDGAVFVLSLAERNLSYFGSEAQDRRKAGEAQWKGDLDAPAIEAMRNGGRIIDAAKNTVTLVDSRVASAIDQEVAERNRLIESLRGRLLAMREEVPRLSAQRLAAFGTALPSGLTAAAVDLPGAEQQVLQALALLTPLEKADLAKATAVHDGLRTRLDGLRVAMETHRAASERLKSLESAQVTLSAHPLAAFASERLTLLRTETETARGAVRDMTLAHGGALTSAEAARAKVTETLDAAGRDGQRLTELAGLLERLATRPEVEDFQEPLAAARLALGQAREAYDARASAYGELLRATEDSYRTAVASADEAEQARRTRNQGGAAGGAGLLLAGVWARRRRNASRRKATELHARWRTAIDEKTHALFGLLERTHLCAGKSREDIEKRFEGVTRERGQQLASDVDELFLLATAAARVLHRAEELLEGAGMTKALGAHLGTARYEQVTRLLRDEPIVFHPDEGVEDVLRGPRTEAQRLIGDLKSYQPFSLSFEALLEAFNTHAERALVLVDSLEKAPTTSVDSVKVLESFSAELKTTASGDAVLRVKDVIGHVTPCLDSLAKQARSLLGMDPLAALEGPLAQGARRMDDALALVTVLDVAAREVLPVVTQAGKALGGAGLSRRWLDDALAALGHTAEETAKALVDQPVKESVEVLGQSFSALATRATEADELVALSARARDSLARVEKETAKARAELGQSMDKPASAMLREKDADPTDRHASGAHSLTEARAALAEGQLDAALTALTATLTRVGEVEALIAGSHEARKSFAARRDACRAEARRLEVRVADGTVLLEALTRGYRPSALRLRPEDPVHPEANGTVQDNLAEVALHRGEAAKRLAESELAYAEARLLATAALLTEVEARHARVHARLDEVEEKSRRLQSTEEGNARTLLVAQGLITACDTDASDARTMQPTRTARDAARQLLLAAVTSAETRPADPFDAAERLASACLSLEQVRQTAASDRAHHAQAEESLASANRALSFADQWIRQAANDGITDSRATTVAINALVTLRRELDTTMKDFAKPHGDWVAFDRVADRIASEAARKSADLRGELRAAEEASDAIRSAASLVQSAATWRGRAGGSQLDSARRALDKGLYQEALRSADSATREARDAIEEAEREEERRREEAREQARARESSSSSSFSSSSSSSSSDSGFSSSSYSSGSSGSGSGFGSSSW
ncbi:hypothetical protein FJV41_20285 [Myxococcus llanfairpwllgwyngyllgogerychwyrndrobwllllantysiliogogogochensis]|uniref:Exonuclease SbcC n=1 Tax=Myxococcus llanfairpwllgwyngyllgogerychwyrndrobwllllantysiliogogogochensis TaxID=2590453 RepID=A0A540WYN5_9BACT|nr:hypothetical protein [Myxococcus llanfairpwllgwyngyllgogerychwyrndrobwllllantysiliogogogochensis]TQF14131.1 hypothetical protein FJV41_20285 [Myxococcus llanfairpwllgwyngyllgogerychwyrndrobwllllantysiliogogogochensis]